MQGKIMEVNIGNMFANRAFLTPDLEACVGDDYRYNYREVNQRLNRFAAYLTRSGIKEGDRIGILAKNGEQVITALFGAAKIGVISVVLNFRLKGPEISYILGDSLCRLLVYGDEFTDTVQTLKGNTPVEIFVSVGGNSPDQEFESALEDQDPAEPVVKGRGDDPAVLMYTSGTTGKPKGATLTHANCFWAAVGLVHTLDWAHKYRFLSVAPLFHIGGLAPVFANIHVGCSMYFMPDFDPAKAWRIIQDEKISLAMTVPVMLQYMNMVPGVDKMDLSRLKYFICGGAPVPESLIDTYKEKKIPVYQVYGATEYTGAITFWTHDMGLDKADSVGKPVFHGDIAIVDPVSKEVLGPDEVGEICILGPQIFKGYWENPMASKEVLVDNYYRSGDLGKKDARGFLYLVDRLKDMIISGGENIYPAEIESVLLGHPDVADVAVAGKPDKAWGEIPVAFVVKKDAATLVEADLFQLCRENLAGFKCVKEIKFIDEIPRNTLGKVLKRSLRDRLS
jgi:fatty-acyl-CoA synthase